MMSLTSQVPTGTGTEVSKMPAEIKHFCYEVPQFEHGQNNPPQCNSLPFPAVRKTAVFPSFSKDSFASRYSYFLQTKYELQRTTHRFKQHVTLLCIHPLLTGGRDSTHLIPVLRFLSEIVIYHVRGVYFSIASPLTGLNRLHRQGVCFYCDHPAELVQSGS